MGESAGRAIAERRLVETCTIRRPGADTFDPEDGLVAATGALVWSGSCRLGSAPPAAGAPSTASGEERLIATDTILLPAAASCRVGDRITITGRDAVYVVVAPDDRIDPVLRHVKVRHGAPGEGLPR